MVARTSSSSPSGKTAPLIRDQSVNSTSTSGISAGTNSSAWRRGSSASARPAQNNTSAIAILTFSPFASQMASALESAARH
ncbi:hypothetical protein DRJ54_02105 [Candidatus Acetothermia bacterium]|nr:MAG: hypothetical protein DRJ54_02105 [Candidatus Acetothermia bacterium]